MSHYEICLKKCACKWRMGVKHIKGYSYLNNACYLSGVFPKQCPDKRKATTLTTRRIRSIVLDLS